MPESTELDLKLASGTVHARRWGSPDAPLALWVHGLSANLHAFDYLAERIAGPSRQLVALDLRGRGRSEITAPGSYGLTAHAQDALEAATLLGADRFDYVGWSLGALIGITGAGLAGERLRSLALPAVNLGIIMAAYVTRVTRSSMLEVLGEDYIRTARAKGVPTRAVIWRHAFRNGLIPVVTVVGLYLGILIGNSVLTEIVFNRPGLGKLIVSALNQRDYTVLQGMMVVYAFIIVLVNLLTDLTYGFIDPRVKRQ